MTDEYDIYNPPPLVVEGPQSNDPGKISLTIDDMRSLLETSMRRGNEYIWAQIALQWMEGAEAEIHRVRKLTNDDAKRLDWLEENGWSNYIALDGPIDKTDEEEANWYVGVSLEHKLTDRYSGYGATLREAIDEAMSKDELV